MLKPEELFYLNKMVTMALVEFLKLQFNIDAKIKWPNDIYVGDKKIAGILIENTIQGKYIKHAIVGIGLNINQDKFSNLIHQKCTSAKLLTGKDYVVNEITLHLLHQLHNTLEMLMSKRFQALTDFYMKHLYRLNEAYQFKVNFEKVNGTIVGVNKQGKLIVLINGEFKTFGNKEIEYVI
jgi:BirA family biotin operon repressor/biotin-[acetyl-CoA-carboxylase] ligase